ncbi:MAG TPA: hypothetical protein VG797_04170 [Phycisphaerales bacterium]|nr:hypothetical protein [Phycisphaerales bacterium]
MDIQPFTPQLTVHEAKQRLLEWAAEQDEAKALRSGSVRPGQMIAGAALGLLVGRLLFKSRAARGLGLVTFAVVAPVVRWGIFLALKTLLRSSFQRRQGSL